jgi:hypothetical protein
VAEMSVMPSILALETRTGGLPARLRRWQRSGSERRPNDAPISPRIVYPAVVVASLVMWFALVELILALSRLSLFS